jgi:selenide,water dikinase
VLRPLEHLFDDGDHPNLLVGLGQPDDAAVWRLDSERALVVTTDFFTPVVDTPYEFGAIAAANSLSDVYAMGGVPFMGLNIAAFPPELPPEFLSEILRGGVEKARQADVIVAGGHTVQDKEPKYGLIALGIVHPEKMLTKGAARPGDVLMLSKPLGFGTTTTAIKNGQASPEDVAEVIDWMTRLNRDAAVLAVEFGLRAATDITGYSLLGHAWEVASTSGVGMRLAWEQIPFTRGARRYAEQFNFPGGASDNRLYFEQHIRYGRRLDEAEKMLLFDPQTSGGLLLAVPAGKADAMLARAEQMRQPLWVIGEVVAGERIEIV